MVCRPTLVLCALLAWAPLPLASNRPWSVALLGAGLFALAAWTAWRAPAGRRSWPLAQRWALAGFGWAFAWALIQTTPGLEAGLIQWADVEVLIGRPTWGSLSLDPWATANGTLRLATYATAAWLGAALVGADARAGRLVLRTLAILGALLAAYGLGVLASGTQTVWWIEKWIYHDVVTATFVNRNAYAVYAGICAAAALLLAESAATRRARWMWRACAGMGLVAIVFTETRWGLVCVLAGLAALALARPPGRAVPWRALLGGVAALVLLVPGLLLVGGRGRWLERLDPAYVLGDLRWDLYRVTLGAIAEAPWTGHGLGTFPVLYHHIRDASLEGYLVLSPHSLPLDLGVELGIPAALALISAFVALALGSLRRARTTGDPTARLAVAAAVMAGGHGLLDFSMTVPAVAVTVLVLLGAGSAVTAAASASAPTSAPAPAAAWEHGVTGPRPGP